MQKLWIAVVSSVFLVSPLLHALDKDHKKNESSKKQPAQVKSVATSPSNIEKIIISSFKNACLNNLSDMDKIDKFATDKKYVKKEKNAKTDKAWVIYENKEPISRINLYVNKDLCIISGMTVSDAELRISPDKTPISNFIEDTLKATLKETKSDGKKILKHYAIKYKDNEGTITYRQNEVPLKTVPATNAYTTILTVKAVKDQSSNAKQE